jgi:hypothetical protein
MINKYICKYKDLKITLNENQSKEKALNEIDSKKIYRFYN